MSVHLYRRIVLNAPGSRLSRSDVGWLVRLVSSRLWASQGPFRGSRHRGDPPTGFGHPDPRAIRTQLSGLMVIRKREFGPTMGELGPNSLKSRALRGYRLWQRLSIAPSQGRKRRQISRPLQRQPRKTLFVTYLWHDDRQSLDLSSYRQHAIRRL
jgi:hypothetical protein